MIEFGVFLATSSSSSSSFWCFLYFSLLSFHLRKESETSKRSPTESKTHTLVHPNPSNTMIFLFAQEKECSLSLVEVSGSRCGRFCYNWWVTLKDLFAPYVWLVCLCASGSLLPLHSEWNPLGFATRPVMSVCQPACLSVCPFITPTISLELEEQRFPLVPKKVVDGNGV